MRQPVSRFAAAAALLAAAFAANAQTPPALEAARNGAEMLFTNQYVVPGGYLLSQNQQYVGIMRNDGRFCVYHGKDPARPGPVVRCAPADPQPAGAYNLWMRDDGNLCVSGAGSVPVVCLPGTPRPRGQYFAVMMNSGGFELYPGRGWNPVSNVAYWTMSTLPEPKVAAGPTPAAGTTISPAGPPANRLPVAGAVRSSLALEGNPQVPLLAVEGLESPQALSAQAFAAGRVRQGTAKLTKSFTGDKELFTWRQAMIDGRNQFKTATITFYDAAGKSLGHYTLQHAWAAKYTGPSLNARNSANATEAIEVRYDAVTFAR
jgi:phage tail-like protein